MFKLKGGDPYTCCLGISIFNPFPTSYYFCHLLSHLLIFLAFTANNMDPDQTAPKGAV